MVYAGVIMSKGGMIYSNIYDKEGNKVRPQDKVETFMMVRAVLKVDSLYIGEKARLQISLIEAEVEDSDPFFERLL